MTPTKLERTKCQIFSRVNGWLVPKSACNPGKQAEWGDRVVYDVSGKDFKPNK